MKKKKKRSFLRFALVAGGVGALAYAVAIRQRPGPSVAAGGPRERVLVKDEDNLSGLGTIMQMMIVQMLENPRKAVLLDTMNLILAIQPLDDPETAITMTFSDGYVVLEPGVVPSPDVCLTCDFDVLMKMATMGSGLGALRFLLSPEGRELAQKFMSGQVQVRGFASHPISMYRFSRFLAPDTTPAG